MLATAHLWEFLVTVYPGDPDPGAERDVRRQPRPGARAPGSDLDGARQLLRVRDAADPRLVRPRRRDRELGHGLRGAEARRRRLHRLPRRPEIRHRHELAGILASGAIAPRRTRTAIREGFIVGVTNPKGLVIFTAILPPFIDRAQGHDTLQLLTLGAICIAIAFLSDSLWGIFSGTARHWFGRSPKRLERLSATGGVMLVGLGVGLAVTGNRR